MQNKFNKVFILVNNPLFVHQHLVPIIDILKKEADVYIICEYDSKFTIRFKNIKFIKVPIKRKPSLIDICAIFKFMLIRIKYKPDLCISFTPKAGLINSLTNFLYGKSFHYFTGQRWASLKGINRLILKIIDRFIISNCIKNYCDSLSQAKFISKELNIDKVKVLGRGSISGVNINKFNIKKSNSLKLINQCKIKNKKELIKLLNDSYKNKIKIICFIGRVNKDKGIRELVDGFKLHNKIFKDSYLLIIGPNELTLNEFKKIQNLKNCLYVDFFENINLILPLTYCLILPSYREGFGSIIIEAAASKTPVISTNIPGPKDFIIHKKNGYLIKPKDLYEINKALNFFRDNNDLLRTFTNNAFRKCLEDFSEEYVCNLFVQEILNNL